MNFNATPNYYNRYRSDALMYLVISHHGTTVLKYDHRDVVGRLIICLKRHCQSLHLSVFCVQSIIKTTYAGSILSKVFTGIETVLKFPFVVDVVERYGLSQSCSATDSNSYPRILDVAVKSVNTTRSHSLILRG
ncbi:hypothetical protein TNCV_258541 [Trichonephila clavipes]|uniref:Uncharacterized protein n=1 Tax=Trichonephila clavipes TaxID=2585209 RepID=A0A8X6RSM5_TRICX|nr:hypothetical protein TNCV_258541 [Trichonephila clavipes]